MFVHSFTLVICSWGMADGFDRHSAEELEAMDEDEDVPPPMPKLNQTFVNGA